jgi:hypothetical protein
MATLADPISAYELERLAQIKSNEELLASLGLATHQQLDVKPKYKRPDKVVRTKSWFSPRERKQEERDQVDGLISVAGCPSSIASSSSSSCRSSSLPERHSSSSHTIMESPCTSVDTLIDPEMVDQDIDQSDYEAQRLAQIRENEMLLIQLGLDIKPEQKDKDVKPKIKKDKAVGVKTRFSTRIIGGKEKSPARTIGGKDKSPANFGGKMTRIVDGRKKTPASSNPSSPQRLATLVSPPKDLLYSLHPRHEERRTSARPVRSKTRVSYAIFYPGGTGVVTRLFDYMTAKNAVMTGGVQDTVKIESKPVIKSKATKRKRVSECSPSKRVKLEDAGMRGRSTHDNEQDDDVSGLAFWVEIPRRLPSTASHFPVSNRASVTSPGSSSSRKTSAEGSRREVSTISKRRDQSVGTSSSGGIEESKRAVKRLCDRVVELRVSAASGSPSAPCI